MATILLLFFAVLHLVRAPARPALSLAIGGTAATVQATVQANARLPLPGLVLAHQSNLVATPSPEPAAELLNAVTLAGPQVLQLWNGLTVTVQPAEAQWRSRQLQWQVADATAGWHTSSADCGAGVTIIGGHVFYGGKAGIFADLATLGPADAVVCTDRHGVDHHFVPVDYLLAGGKDSPLSWTPGWMPALLLYTCTPELNGQIIVVRFKEQ